MCGGGGRLGVGGESRDRVCGNDRGRGGIQATTGCLLKVMGRVGGVWGVWGV